MSVRLITLPTDVAFRGSALVSASEAAALCERWNTSNRRVRKNFIDYLVEIIRSGQWQPDHPQPIVFSGIRLIDGQHRLIAIARANLPQDLVVSVVMGARDELREHIDMGISRQQEDRVTFHPDLPSNLRCSRLVNALAACMNSAFKAPNRLTPTDAHALFAANRDEILFALPFASRKAPGFTVGFFVALMQYYSRSPIKAEEFATDVLSVDSALQPCRRLREYLKTRPCLSGASGLRDTYSKSVCAMRSHMNGQTLTSLRTASWE